MPFLIIRDKNGQERELILDGPATIGRTDNNPVCLPEAAVSRRHAELQPADDSYAITDLHSANGTFLNRKQIPPAQPQQLQDGDEISVGTFRLTYRLHATTHKQDLPVEALFRPKPNDVADIEATFDATMSMQEVRQEERKSADGLLIAIKRLQTMVALASDVATVTERSAVHDRIMESIFDVFPQADRAFMLLSNPLNGDLDNVITRGREGTMSNVDEMGISATIIHAVVDQKEAIISSDAQQDQRFEGANSILQHSIRSVMCAPLLWRHSVLGILGINTVDTALKFNHDDLAMLTSIASQAAVALKSVQLHEQVQEETRNRTMLSRYISPDIVDALMAGQIPLNLEAEMKCGTVLFADIVGFTALSEKMNASQIIELLNKYFRIATESITGNRGTLHKFGGDMILSFWNVLIPEQNAEFCAVKTGLQMQQAVKLFNYEINHDHALHIGIGINTGAFAGGNVGGEMIEYTIIGDNVNLAQRLESLAGAWQIFTSKTTYEAVAGKAIAIRLPDTKVKGKSKPIPVFSIRGLELAPHHLLLALPVLIQNPDSGNILDSGLIAEAHGSGDELEFTVFTGADSEAGGCVNILFDVPELSLDNAMFQATVKEGSNSNDAQDETILWRTIQCIGIQMNESLHRLLTPGTCFISDKNWPDLKRQ